MSHLSGNGRSFFSLSYCLCIPIGMYDIKCKTEIEKLIVDTFLIEAGYMKVSYLSHEFNDNCVIFGFSSMTNINLSQFVNAYKTFSSRRIRNRYSFSWAGSYCLCSIGDEKDVREHMERYMKQYKLLKKG